ncbi:hypothetical protein [Azospirillum sp. SYSU D00513]|uniref:hypothetical protein n=1 Tax=Azospirillum sp. SYSU D00513 TaxID=2812561 RepID=UPI001A96816D|nr:hypothetical protein [Azospirillum sp. SYSU D00513]
MFKEKTALMALRVIYTLAILPSLLFACTTPFMYDAPGSTENAYTDMAASGHLLLPPTLLLAILIGRYLQRKGRLRAALLVHLLPLAPVALGGLGWYFLITVCNGQFACR